MKTRFFLVARHQAVTRMCILSKIHYLIKEQTLKTNIEARTWKAKTVSVNIIIGG